jgi:hypothetical protein
MLQLAYLFKVLLRMLQPTYSSERIAFDQYSDDHLNGS